jgi:hypothetical protein
MNQHSRAVTIPRSHLTLALWLAALCLAPAAYAWKPITHVYLAEEAREAMVSQGGRISVEEVDFWRHGVVGPVGTYPISSEVYQALRDYPSYYRAGVLGPDAYPDMIFGQTVIHPSEVDASGADRWLRHLYSQARTPQERAFVWGFLAHAAGDMFGHTFVNTYSGGNFTLMPIDNAIKHIVVEGYVGRFTPPLRPGSYTIETDAVNGFIYENLINAQRSRDGQTKNLVWQLVHDNPKTRYGSLPALFTRLREGLKDKVAAHYDLVRELREKYKEAASKCKPWRPVWCAKAVYYKALLWANQLIGGLAADYLEAWIRDIDRGLKAWPKTSTQVARAAFMSLDPATGQVSTDIGGVTAALGDYKSRYLCSMLGVPDSLCTISRVIKNIIETIIPINLFEELMKSLLKWLVKKATGLTVEEWTRLLKAEATDVDRWLPPSGGIPPSVHLREAMGVDPGAARPIFTHRPTLSGNGTPLPIFSPAYNTRASISLSFLDTRAQWQGVLRDVGWAPSNPSGLMDQFRFNGQLFLDYVKTLDGSNQWRGLSDGNPWRDRGRCPTQRYTTEFNLPAPLPSIPYRRMFLVEDCGLFSRFFMQQTGDCHAEPTATASPEWRFSECAEMQALNAVAPPLQCGGFLAEAELTRAAGPLGAVIRMDGTFSNNQSMVRHVWLPAGSTRQTYPFTGAPANIGGPMSLSATRLERPGATLASSVGQCGPTETCTNNVCVGTCQPTTCAAQGAQCGSIPDGCGGSLVCGSCPGGQGCVSNVCGPVSPNLALGAPTLASSTFCSGTGVHCYSPARITDGSTDTSLGGFSSWANDSGPLPQWVQLNLGAPSTFSRIELYTTAGFELRDYQVDVFSGGTGGSWVNLVTVTGNTQTRRTHVFPAVTGNVLRVVGYQGPPHQPGYVRINEVEVYAN